MVNTVPVRAQHPLILLPALFLQTITPFSFGVWTGLGVGMLKLTDLQEKTANDPGNRATAVPSPNQVGQSTA